MEYGKGKYSVGTIKGVYEKCYSADKHISRYFDLLSQT